MCNSFRWGLLMTTTKTFFTSDSHFFHHNVIGYCNRPFLSVDEMDEYMIEKWNSVVGKGDVVYHLGDFAITGYSKKHTPKVEKLLGKLNGNKILIRGNHDAPAVLEATGWGSVKNLHHINIDGQRIIMCHYPMRSWQFKAHGSWMLYGHCHHNLPPVQGELSLDVGVDGWDFTPLSFNRIKGIMDLVERSRDLKPEDM
jgi:calcineurin-like phosphoesterase family protein